MPFGCPLPSFSHISLSFLSLSFTSHNSQLTSIFLLLHQRTNTLTDTHEHNASSSFLIFAPKPIASITHTPLSDRCVSLSPTDKKRRKGSSLLFLTQFYSLQHTLSFPWYFSLQILNLYHCMWVTNTGFVMGLISHPFVSSDNFRIIFFSFGDSIVMLNWLHANGVSLKFLIKRFGFEFWVFFFVDFCFWIDPLGMNLCAFQFCFPWYSSADILKGICVCLSFEYGVLGFIGDLI